jgi:hypothetical protein
MRHEALQEIVEAHGLAFGLLANASGVVLARAGDFDAPDFHGLRQCEPTCIPTTPEQIRFMFEWLDGKILPQMVSQGSACVLLMRPQGRLLAVFGVRSAARDVIRLYHHSKVVSASLEAGLVGGVSA